MGTPKKWRPKAEDLLHVASVAEVPSEEPGPEEKTPASAGPASDTPASDSPASDTSLSSEPEALHRDVPQKSDAPCPPGSVSSADQEIVPSTGDLGAATIELKSLAPRDSAKHRFDELKINFLARYSGVIKSVMFLGTSRGDGASTMAFNFATSLAQDADLRVLFINADLRTPSSPPDTTDRASASSVTSLAQWEPHAPVSAHPANLHILPGGRGYADPAVLFQSRRFDNFMVQMAGQFDYIVVDGPPLDDAPESIALSTKVDGVILVIDAQQTRRKIAFRAKRRIEDVGGKLLGVVLNRRRYYVPDWLYKRI